MISQETWEKFKTGDMSSLEKIYAENIDAIFLYGKKYTQDHDLIGDMIQDLFIHLWESRKNLSTPTSIKAYLLRSFKNRLIDHFRKSKKIEPIGEYNTSQNLDPSIEDEIIQIESQAFSNQKLSKALENLTSKQKEIIHLRYNQNLPYEEIAEILEINYQSVRNLAHRAITIMRKEFLIVVLFYMYAFFN